MIFPESAAAHRLLDGLSGIEIGGASHNPFRIAGCRNVDFTGDMTTSFKESEKTQAGAGLAVDIVAPGDALPLDDVSLDYVLSSHVLEHFWDPIGAIEEWLRVLRPGGIVFMIVPHKERTRDINEKRTTLAELIQRHRGELQPPPGAEPHMDLHYSFWVTADIVELLNHLGLELLEAHDVDDKVGNGFTIITRKPGILESNVAIDLGCGAKKRVGTVGIDCRPGPAVDLVCDVTRQPLPFATGSVRAVYSNGLFQLLDDPVPLLREILRITRPGGHVEIFTPHGASEASMTIGSRQRFSEFTWLEMLSGNAFAHADGSFSLRELVSLVPPATISGLQAGNLPLDFAMRHFNNVISRIGALLTVHKPGAFETLHYARRVTEDRG